MSVRFRPRDPSTTGSQFASALVGAIAGVAAGVVLAQLLGGGSGIAARFRPRPAALDPEPGVDADWDDAGEDLEEADGDKDRDEAPPDDLLGRRVLEAFVNDPILAHRAIDIDVHPDATVELSGSVDEEREVAYARTLARGVPGVKGVVADLVIGG